MTSFKPLLDDLSEPSAVEIGLCHNMHYEKAECSCDCPPVDYTSSYRYFHSQAPYSSALPPPGQFMSDMEGK